MDFTKQILANRQALVSDLLHRTEVALAPFQVALNCFLATLFQSKLPANWRQEWHRFVAWQLSQGIRVDPQSVRELEDWMEDWARFCRLLPTTESAQKPPAASRLGANPAANREDFFDQQLATAERHLDEIGQVLATLGGTLDAATPGRIVDVDAEVIAIEESIWQYNAAVASARAAWLRADLSVDANRRLLALRTPRRWGLPEFTDELQAHQALHQGAQVNERLRRRNQSVERVDVGMAVAQLAETSNGIALGGGAAMTVTKQNARWIVFKKPAAIASPQTIHGTDVAAAVIAYILRHRPGRRDPVAVFPSLASQMRQPARSTFQLAADRSTAGPPIVPVGLMKPAKRKPVAPAGPAPKSKFNDEGFEIAGPGPETTERFRAKVQLVLDILDGQVARWWKARSIAGLVRSRDAAGWLTWYRSNVLATVENERPIITVDKNFTAEQTAEAIISEARDNSGAFHDSFVDFILHRGDPSTEFSQERLHALRQAAGQVGFIAERVIDLVTSFTPGGDLVLTINDLAENGPHWSQLLTVLPFLGHLPIAAVVIKLGNKTIRLPKQLLEKLKQLSSKERSAAMASAAAAKTEQEATVIIERAIASKARSRTKTGAKVAAGAKGPGGWAKVPENMSPRARAYQTQISGREEVYVVNGVKFDGFKEGTLLETKGPGYVKFVKDDKFRDWFTKVPAILDQAKRQSAAANGMPIVWHVADPEAAVAIRKLLDDKKIFGISVVHTVAK